MDWDGLSVQVRTCYASDENVFTQVVLVAWEAMGETNERLDGNWEGYGSVFRWFFEMSKKKQGI